MDLYVRNTCIEFKTNILRHGVPNASYISQMDGYLENLLKASTDVRNGILTDGVQHFLRRVGEEKLPMLPHGALQTFERPRQAERLREYLHGIITAPAEDIHPTAASDESDWLFIRHAYITSLVALIMQQQLLGDVAPHVAERPDALLKGRILAEQLGPKTPAASPCARCSHRLRTLPPAFRSRSKAPEPTS